MLLIASESESPLISDEKSYIYISYISYKHKVIKFPTFGEKIGENSMKHFHFLHFHNLKNAKNILILVNRD